LWFSIKGSWNKKINNHFLSYVVIKSGVKTRVFLGSVKEKAFVRSKSLPKEKQVRMTKQRNDSKHTKKQFFSIKRKTTTLSSV